MTPFAFIAARIRLPRALVLKEIQQVLSSDAVFSANCVLFMSGITPPPADLFPVTVGMVKVRDEALWLQARMELATDGEQGKAMEEFVTDWCTRAEDSLENSREFLQPDGSWSGEENPAMALRAALPATEMRCGSLSFSSLIQALVIVLAVWEHGPEVFDYLTIFEKRAVLEMTAIKQAELTTQAAGVDPGT